MTKEQTLELIKKYGKSEKDSGTPEVQIAILTARIEELSQHLAANVKDKHSRIGLMRMVGKRKRLLEYLHNKNIERYKKILQELDIRK
jgi:small subunit ribosomal protein S15